MANKKKDATTHTGPLKLLADMLEVPLDTVSHVPKLEMVSNTEAVLDGCTGVLEYADDVIKLACGKHLTVKFSGQNLEIKTLSCENVSIIGRIAAVEFLG